MLGDVELAQFDEINPDKNYNYCEQMVGIFVDISAL